MNKFLWPVVLVCWLCPTNLGAQSTPYYQSHFPPEEFKARWERIFERLGTNGVAVVQGMAQVNGFIFPRQNNEFYYLCGIEKYDPDAYALLDDFYGGRIEISKVEPVKPRRRTGVDTPDSTQPVADSATRQETRRQ